VCIFHPLKVNCSVDLHEYFLLLIIGVKNEWYQKNSDPDDMCITE
jgi:hypothetical protein